MERSRSHHPADEAAGGDAAPAGAPGKRTLTSSLPPVQRAADRGGSEPLPASVRTPMEGYFGHDFSSVRIEAGSAEASSLNAHAFTRGEEVHFAAGKLDPETSSGRELIGHELAHVVQQREGRVTATRQMKGEVAVNDDQGLEAEADQRGAEAARACAPGAEAPAVPARPFALATAPLAVVQGYFVRDSSAKKPMSGAEVQSAIAGLTPTQQKYVLANQGSENQRRNIANWIAKAKTVHGGGAGSGPVAVDESSDGEGADGQASDGEVADGGDMDVMPDQSGKPESKGVASMDDDEQEEEAEEAGPGRSLYYADRSEFKNELNQIMGDTEKVTKGKFAKTLASLDDGDAFHLQAHGRYACDDDAPEDATASNQVMFTPGAQHLFQVKTVMDGADYAKHLITQGLPKTAAFTLDLISCFSAGAREQWEKGGYDGSGTLAWSAADALRKEHYKNGVVVRGYVGQSKLSHGGSPFEIGAGRHVEESKDAAPVEVGWHVDYVINGDSIKIVLGPKVEALAEES